MLAVVLSRFASTVRDVNALVHLLSKPPLVDDGTNNTMTFGLAVCRLCCAFGLKAGFFPMLIMLKCKNVRKEKN